MSKSRTDYPDSDLIDQAYSSKYEANRRTAKAYGHLHEIMSA